MYNRVGVGRRLRVLAGGLAVGALAVTTISSVGSANAAVPDRYGFVLWSGGTIVGSGSTPAATSVGVGGPGLYKIDFPGQAAKGGVAHVTAINSVPHWCQVNALVVSGPDEIVAISCYKVGGAADFTDFSLVFSSSSGAPSAPFGSYGYVDSLPSGALVSQYNSAGVGNGVTHLSPGQWTVKFPNLATPGPIDGSLQATAVSPASVPMRCKLLGWSSGPTGQTAQVNCYNAGGVPADTEFMLTYQYQRALYGGFGPPKYFGYLWNQPPVGPVSTNYNNPLGPGMNAVSPGTIAVVKFPSLAVLPDDVQVTSAGQGSDFCGLNAPWAHSGGTTIAQVNCFTNAGTPIGSGFLISDNSQN